MREVVTDVLTARPILGICLGLQALYAFSEEDGGTAGFGIMAGNVHRFPAEHEAQGQLLKVRLMGWNKVCQAVSHPLWRGIADDTRFYFVHSYYAHSAESAEVAGTTAYGFSFISAAARANIFAVQFHPEKSHRQGLTLLQNFVRWDGGF